MQKRPDVKTLQDRIFRLERNSRRAAIHVPDKSKLYLVISNGKTLNAADDPDYQLSIANAEISGIEDKVYNGSAHTQNPVVMLNGSLLAEGTDYEVSYNNNVNAGTASVTVSGTGSYCGQTGAEFLIARADNTVSAKGRVVKVSRKKLRKQKTVIKAARAYTVSNAQGRVTYEKVSVSAKKANKRSAKRIKINEKTGKITVKRWTRKGTYKVKVRITAAGNGNYNPASTTAVVTIKVK